VRTEKGEAAMETPRAGVTICGRDAAGMAGRRDGEREEATGR